MTMTLQEACAILTRAQTRDDGKGGYVVQWSPGDYMRQADRPEYIEAWGVLRRFVAGESVAMLMADHVTVPAPLGAPKILGFNRDMPGINDDPMAAERFIKKHGGDRRSGGGSDQE